MHRGYSLQRVYQCTYHVHIMGCPYPLKIVPTHGGSGPHLMHGSKPHLIHGSLAHPNPQPKRHLDRFSHFCMAHNCDRLTDRQTDHTTLSVGIGHIYVRSTVMQPNNNNFPLISVIYSDIFNHSCYHESELRFSTQIGSFHRRSSQPTSWHSTKETKPNTTKANNTRTKQSKLNQKNT